MREITIGVILIALAVIIFLAIKAESPIAPASATFTGTVTGHFEGNYSQAFTFNYPPAEVSATATMENKVIDLENRSNDEPMGKIMISDQSGRGLSPESYYQEEILKIDPQAKMATTSPVHITGAESLVTVTGQGGNEWIVWYKNPWLFAAQINSAYKKQLENILVTFQFK